MIFGVVVVAVVGDVDDVVDDTVIEDVAVVEAVDVDVVDVEDGDCEGVDLGKDLFSTLAGFRRQMDCKDANRGRRIMTTTIAAAVNNAPKSHIKQRTKERQKSV